MDVHPMIASLRFSAVAALILAIAGLAGCTQSIRATGAWD
jgi:hypothetical protein